MRSLPSRLATIALGLLMLTGCANTAAELDNPRAEIADPLEGFNRAIYGINEATDILVLGPASTIYREGAPEPVQTLVRNFLRNLEMPIIAINKLLQGNVDGFGTAVGRFVVNSTIGIGGVADWATDMGLPYEDTDFGATLASWGMEPSFYLVLPLVGPSNLRDGVGRGVDMLADPVGLVADNHGLEGEYFTANSVRAIDTRAGLDAAIRDVRKNSIDSYSALRSLYTQRRAAELRAQFADDTGK